MNLNSNQRDHSSQHRCLLVSPEGSASIQTIQPVSGWSERRTSAKTDAFTKIFARREVDRLTCVTLILFDSFSPRPL